MNPKMQELRKKAMALPLLPGVYIMHDKSGEIIYIGKAKALKNRVSQYFGSQNNHAEKVRRMVDNVDDFEYIITDSEFEALILECSLIKQHTPKYNILLKDDKGYSYIRVSSGDWGKLSYVLQKRTTVRSISDRTRAVITSKVQLRRLTRFLCSRPATDVFRRISARADLVLTTI